MRVICLAISAALFGFSVNTSTASNIVVKLDDHAHPVCGYYGASGGMTLSLIAAAKVGDRNARAKVESDYAAVRQSYSGQLRNIYGLSTTALMRSIDSNATERAIDAAEAGYGAKGVKDFELALANECQAMGVDTFVASLA